MSNCLSKIPYLEEEAKKLAKDVGGYYECKECGYYHLTRSKKVQGKRI